MIQLLQDPLALAALAAGFCGLLLLVHAKLQAQLLRHRIASGEGSAVIDPETGLFAPSTLSHCVRAETNRATRLDRKLDVWVTRVDELETGSGTPAMQSFARDLPPGSIGLRLDARHLCVLSCLGPEADPARNHPGLEWRHQPIEPGMSAELTTLRFLKEAVDA